jgi:predicted AlkP superfamily pyrophosphatase or phosphodiesterase
VTLLCEPVFDKDQTERVPTVDDAAHAAGLKTAAICWPATRNAAGLDWQVPDMGGDAWNLYGTRSWLDELRQAGLPVDMQGPWVTEPAGGVQRDWLYARMAAQVLCQHAPNLLLVHLVEPDHVQHRTGPRSPDAYWCTSHTDDRLRDIVEAAARSPRAGKTTIIVCGDHGFMPIERDIRPNVLLRKLGLIRLSGTSIDQQAARCLSQGGGCAVYVLDEARRSEILTQLQSELAKVEGVQAVLSETEFTKLGQPARQQDSRAPDLWLAAERGYSFSDTPAGEDVIVSRKTVGGTHGYLPDQPELLAACVMWGPTVKPATRLGKISMLDLAPTIAGILGVPLPTAEGRPLPPIGTEPVR